MTSLVTLCSVAKEQFPKAAAFGALSFVLSLSRDKESTSQPAQRGAKQYARPSAKSHKIQYSSLIE